MAKFSKNDFLLFKGKKLTFKRVKYGADIKVEMVQRFGDVKLKVVDHFPDFKVFID